MARPRDMSSSEKEGEIAGATRTEAPWMKENTVKEIEEYFWMELRMGRNEDSRLASGDGGGGASSGSSKSSDERFMGIGATS